ncbi:MAG: metallophosphoesterase [Ferruginibacter sp.]
MFRRFLQRILSPVLTRLAAHASAPVKKDVFDSLSKLYQEIADNTGARGMSLEADGLTDRFIIFSDQHKGNGDEGDDFATNAVNYVAALNFYNEQNYNYINLGDAEELWKYSPKEVLSHYADCFHAENFFHRRGSYYKTFGNHDITWKNKLDVNLWFNKVFRLPLPVWEGILLKFVTAEKPFNIFVTHGHQGDKMSDNNHMSTWMVSHLWRPLQRYLRINVNTPAKDYVLRDRHNILMYEWSHLQENLVLITGHTHKPVFAAGLYSDHPNNTIPINKIDTAEKITTLRPSYFNTGCCCFNDGDITGIEISEGAIRLVKWHFTGDISIRSVLEEKSLLDICRDL